MKLIYNIFFVFLITSCISNTRKNNYSDIIYEIVNRTVTDYRYVIAPSPNDIKKKEDLGKFRKKSDSLREIYTQPLKVIVNDSLSDFSFNTTLLSMIKPHLSPKDYAYIVTNKITNDYDLDLKKISNENYHFVYKSNFSQKDKDYYLKQNPRSIIPTYYFYKIIFNESKDLAILESSLVYNPKFGQSNLFILEKIKSNWNIKKSILYSIY